MSEYKFNEYEMATFERMYQAIIEFTLSERVYLDTRISLHFIDSLYGAGVMGQMPDTAKEHAFFYAFNTAFDNEQEQPCRHKAISLVEYLLHTDPGYFEDIKPCHVRKMIDTYLAGDHRFSDYADIEDRMTYIMNEIFEKRPDLDHLFSNYDYWESRANQPEFLAEAYNGAVNELDVCKNIWLTDVQCDHNIQNILEGYELLAQKGFLGAGISACMLQTLYDSEEPDSGPITRVAYSKINGFLNNAIQASQIIPINCRLDEDALLYRAAGLFSVAKELIVAQGGLFEPNSTQSRNLRLLGNNQKFLHNLVAKGLKEYFGSVSAYMRQNPEEFYFEEDGPDQNNEGPGLKP